MTETVSNPTLRDLEPRQIGALIEAKLIEWNISYEYDPAVPIADLKQVDQAQVRNAEHRRDPDTVEQFATHMREGVVFPPLVLLHEDIVLDGNTRIAAAKQARIRTLAAFKCNFPNAELAVAFAGAMNQMGGRRLSPEEARYQAEVLMRYGYEDDSIARELGYGRTHVNNWRREHEAADRAQRTWVADAFDTIPKPATRKLAGIKMDAPFAAATKLVADTKLPAKRLTDLVKAVQAAPSEAAALTIVGDIRDEINAAGPPPQRVGVPEEIRTARRCLPQLIKLEGRSLALVESDVERRPEWIAQWRVVQQLAGEVIAAHGA